jgi:CBS domain-containing protein
VEIAQASIAELAERPLSSVITVRGKELVRGATVAEARAIFASNSVRLIPVLDEGAYVAAATREDLGGAGDDGSTYVGLVCLARDRAHLCIDADCHAASAPAP